MPASHTEGDCHQSLLAAAPTLTLLRLSSMDPTILLFKRLQEPLVCNLLTLMPLPEFAIGCRACTSASALISVSLVQAFVSSHQAMEMDFWPVFHSCTLLESLVSAQSGPSSAPLLRDSQCFCSGANKVLSGDLGICGQGEDCLVSYQPVSHWSQKTFSKPRTVSFLLLF